MEEEEKEEEDIEYDDSHDPSHVSEEGLSQEDISVMLGVALPSATSVVASAHDANNAPTTPGNPGGGFRSMVPMASHMGVVPRYMVGSTLYTELKVYFAVLPLCVSMC
jgi:hypothetical protein